MTDSLIKPSQWYRDNIPGFPKKATVAKSTTAGVVNVFRRKYRWDADRKMDTESSILIGKVIDNEQYFPIDEYKRLYRRGGLLRTTPKATEMAGFSLRATPPDTDLASSCFKLTLKNYRLPAKIGALDEEHGRTQPVVVTIDVWVEKTALADRLAAAYDYRALPQAVDAAVASGHIELQETLVEAVADALWADTRVKAVRVQSTKPEAYPNCDGISVETFRRR